MNTTFEQGLNIIADLAKQFRRDAAVYRSTAYKEAQARYAEALPIYREIGDRLSEANAYQSIARLEQAQGHHAEALTAFDQALTL